MIRKIVLVMVAVCLFAGCQRGDFRASMVIEGQPAPHAGYNFGPESYVEEGDIVKVTGAVVWARGLDPNDLLE